MKNTKKKDILLNIILTVLVIIMIIQAGFLWIKMPNIKENRVIQEVYNTEDYFKEILSPGKLIVNFSENDHSVFYNFSEVWSIYIEDISNIFMECSRENLEEISYSDYLKLQSEKSIIFKFDREISGRLFLNLLNMSKGLRDESLKIKEIYISNNNIIILNSNGVFKVDYSIKNIPSEVVEDYRKKPYDKYINFYEAYKIPNNIYIPVDGRVSYKKFNYENKIEDMDKVYRNNLVSRVLNHEIDYVREITQMNETNYIYEDRFLKILSDGTIYYENAEKFTMHEINLYLSYKSAISFMSSKMGVTKNIRIDTFEKIENGENYGYRFRFNFTEDNINIYPNSDKFNDYIVIDVFSDHIKTYKQLYRGIIEQPKYDIKETDKMDFKNIIAKNLFLFNDISDIPKEDKIVEIIKNISDINFVYIDNFEKEIIPGFKINYKGRNLFFNLENMEFVMER